MNQQNTFYHLIAILWIFMTILHLASKKFLNFSFLSNIPSLGIGGPKMEYHKTALSTPWGNITHRAIDGLWDDEWNARADR